MIDYQLLTLISQKTIKIIFLLVGGSVVKKAIGIMVKRIKLVKGKLGQTALAKQEKRLKTLRSLIINSSKIIINFILLIMILAELGINITPLITGAGILGLAIGFGAKSLVADLIAGFFIILENQFNVGDQIQVAGHKGKVIKISLRTITLKDEVKNYYIIPNSVIKTVVRLAKKQPK